MVLLQAKEEVAGGEEDQEGEQGQQGQQDKQDEEAEEDGERISLEGSGRDLLFRSS